MQPLSQFKEQEKLVEEQKGVLPKGEAIVKGAEPAEDNEGEGMYNAEKHEKLKDELQQTYPGLAMPNKVFKDEGEIELDLDELDDVISKPTVVETEKESKPVQSRRKSRSRSRSRSRSKSDDSRRKHKRHRRHRSRSSDSDDDRKKRRQRNRRSPERESDKDRGSKRRRRNKSESSEESRGRQHRDVDRQHRDVDLTQEEKMHKVLKIAKIYRGSVQKVIDFGLFIRIEINRPSGGSGPRNCEGLVHVS